MKKTGGNVKKKKSMGYNKSSSKREIYSYTSLPPEPRKISVNQPNSTPSN